MLSGVSSVPPSARSSASSRTRAVSEWALRAIGHRVAYRQPADRVPGALLKDCDATNIVTVSGAKELNVRSSRGVLTDPLADARGLDRVDDVLRTGTRGRSGEELLRVNMLLSCLPGTRTCGESNNMR